VGYRYYDKVKQAPLFHFGHGLSYTTFKLSGLNVQETDPQASDISKSSMSVRAWVTNTGPRAGAEVVQIYVRPPTTASVGRPVRELKGYEKTMLHPGETKEISVTVPMGVATSFWDEGRSAWLSEKGTYAIEVVGTGERNMLSAPLCVQVSRYWNGL
jgi:beta-glucosidase